MPLTLAGPTGAQRSALMGHSFVARPRRWDEHGEFLYELELGEGCYGNLRAALPGPGAMRILSTSGRLMPHRWQTVSPSLSSLLESKKGPHAAEDARLVFC